MFSVFTFVRLVFCLFITLRHAYAIVIRCSRKYKRTFVKLWHFQIIIIIKWLLVWNTRFYMMKLSSWKVLNPAAYVSACIFNRNRSLQPFYSGDDDTGIILGDVVMLHISQALLTAFLSNVFTQRKVYVYEKKTPHLEILKH